MELIVAADSILYKTEDGKYWCKTIYGYEFWTRYLLAFDKVAIVSRTKQISYSEVEGFIRVDGPRVSVKELPYMRGMKDYIKNYFKFTKAAKKAVKAADCALIRLPSVSADMVLRYFKKKRKPFAIEVVADPFDAYSNNKIAQFMYTKKLKKAVLDANGVSYVTRYYLQGKYPSKAKISYKTNNYFESYYSTIDLPIEYFSIPKTFKKNNGRYTIVHTANSINNDNKGHDVLIRVTSKLREKGFDVNVIFIGDGSRRLHFEKLSKELGIEKYIKFTGILSSTEQVRDTLKKGDVFVFPTKAEGLPRAVIEAMAVGLPVISTPVNGIPELLEEEYLFSPEDVDGFVNKLIELFKDPDLLESMSKRNINKAKEYSKEKLSIRRKDFYLKLRKLADVNK